MHHDGLLADTAQARVLKMQRAAITIKVRNLESNGYLIVSYGIRASLHYDGKRAYRVVSSSREYVHRKACICKNVATGSDQLGLAISRSNRITCTTI